MGVIGALEGRFADTGIKTGNPILDALIPMLTKGGALGGLAGLLATFKSAGLGGKADSWVSSGANQPLTNDEVTSALGSGTVEEVAAKAGVSKDEAAGGLASMLPGLFDELSPGGSLPTGNIVKSLKGLDVVALLKGSGK